MRQLRTLFLILLVVGAVGLYDRLTTPAPPDGSQAYRGPASSVTPNWAAIAAWPNLDATLLEATPDPNRRFTALILDDSGSMGPDIRPAKAAIVQSLAAMEADDRVAVIALNKGLMLPFMDVSDAREIVEQALSPVTSDGKTPLTRAMVQAQRLLEEEAALAQSFGTYRMIVTTDGRADNAAALSGVIELLAAATPIQVTTIGIDIGGSHVLRRDDLGSFVDIANVEALGAALTEAIAENADFTAITSEFTEGN